MQRCLFSAVRDLHPLPCSSERSPDQSVRGEQPCPTDPPLAPRGELPAEAQARPQASVLGEAQKPVQPPVASLQGGRTQSFARSLTSPWKQLLSHAILAHPHRKSSVLALLSAVAKERSNLPGRVRRLAKPHPHTPMLLWGREWISAEYRPILKGGDPGGAWAGRAASSIAPSPSPAPRASAPRRSATASISQE